VTGRFGGRVQRFVIRTSPWPPFRWAYALAYAMGLLWLVLRLRRVPEIRSLDLRPPRPGHCFGSSDLDLRAETVPLTTWEFFALADRLADVLLPGGTWLRIFDLYLFPAAEHELQRMVVQQSIRRDRPWIRLRGERVPPTMPVPAPVSSLQARLGRAIYDYGETCQELFEGPIDLHQTRLLYGQVARIDQEATAGCAEAALADLSATLVEQVRAHADGPARRGRVRTTTFDDLARAHALALAQTTALASTVLARVSGARPRSIMVVPPGPPPDNIELAADGCRDAVRELCERAAGAIRNVVLGGVPGSRYEYRLYAILRERLEIAEHVALCRAVRELFITSNPRIPYGFFRLRYPVLLTPSMWEASGQWHHALRPVEEHFFLERHGVLLYGDDDPPPRPVPPDDETIVRSAAIGVADLRNRIWGALYHRRSAHLADLLSGRVPALWLVLARGRVATSPGEMVAACVDAGMSNAEVLVELHEHLAGRSSGDLPTVDDSRWRPALNALPAWMDELVGAAVSALKPPGSP